MIELKSINKDAALVYLGYKNADSLDNINTIMSICEEELLKVIHARFVFRCFEIDRKNESLKLTNCTLNLSGESINEHLSQCDRAVLMCATLSSDVDRLIKKAQIEDIIKAVAFDALASQAIEQVCDLVEDEIRKEYPHSFLTSRFSPGYGDLPIEIQDEFLTVLNAQRSIGLCVTQSNMLTPTKSVTAVIGLSNTKQKNEKTCENCSLKDTCKFKGRGEHCGF